MRWLNRIEIRIDGATAAYMISASPDGATYEASDRPGAATAIPVIGPFDRAFFSTALMQVSVSCDELWMKGAVNVVHGLHASIESNCSRFDETLGAYRAMSGMPESDRSDRLRGASIELISFSNKDLHLKGGAFYPGAMESHLSGLGLGALNAESIQIAHSKIDFLSKVVVLFGFKGGVMVMHLANKTEGDISDSMTYSKLSFLFTIKDGVTVTQDALSYGQKRLLSFLYYVAANDYIIIADEVVNGMHYDWSEACLDAIGYRQSFLTSQSPILLDFLPFASAEEVQKTFIQCSGETPEDKKHRGQMLWKNLSQEQAESFYRAYEAGVQHVGEILRTKGLW